ncbi:hypothetical protein GAY31_04520 [Azospirillum brasilense]|nr:hypothetical protein [Azospirillum brasilense]
MFVFLGGEGRGLLQFHVWPAEKWGIPAQLEKRGFEPLLTTPGHGGWDGQFHFYIANDLLLQEDTAQHIDAPTYRYQRIGLPLLARGLAFLTFGDWVSPLVYWSTSVLLVAAGTFAFAWMLATVGLPPWLSLIWALSGGVQVTMVSGLPDAAADALFLLALACLCTRRLWAYALAATLAVLTRETFVVAAAGLFLFQAMAAWRAGRLFSRSGFLALLPMALPGVVAILWQISILLRFGQLPSQAPGVAGGLVTLPLKGWLETLVGTYRGTHPFAGAGVPQSEFWLQPLHGVLIVMAAAACVVLLRTKRHQPVMAIVAAAALPFAFIATMLGVGVTAFWTGYLKATSFLFVPIILSFALLPRWGTAVAGSVVMLMLGLHQAAFWSRNLNDAVNSTSQYSSIDSVLARPASSFPERLDCLGEYRSDMRLVGVEAFERRALFRAVLGRNARYELRVDVTNATAQPWRYAQGVGSVYLIGRWVDRATGRQLGFTRSTLIGEELKPGESRLLRLVVDVPDYAPQADLIVTMIQAGCSWFHEAGDPGAIRMRLR